MRALVVAAGLAAVLAACGTESDPRTKLCGPEDRSDTYVDGMSKTSDMGRYNVALMSTQVEGQLQPPDRGLNVWDLKLSDASAVPVEGASLKLRSWMPDHGHGTTPNHIPASGGTAGSYAFGPFNLFMSGYWEFTVTVEQAGETDTAKFAFCIEG